MKKDELTLIRERDADFGNTIPSHWQAQLDRRNLLRLLDETLDDCQHTMYCRCI
jgi:hypothetical protein